jgi:Sortase domain
VTEAGRPRDGGAAAARRRRARLWLALSLAVHVGAPTTWLLSRPDTAVGDAAAEERARRQEPVAVRAASRVPTRSARLADNRPAEVTRPVRVRIDSLQVNAPVVEVGVVPGTGEMEVPADVDDVGWYTHGPAPGGRRGAAVLAAHVDSRVQGPGVFFGLRSLEPGQEVAVTLADGASLRYRVVARRSYPKEVLATEELFAREGEPHLVLLTCGGQFDRASRHYRDNVVVWAELLSREAGILPSSTSPHRSPRPTASEEVGRPAEPDRPSEGTPPSRDSGLYRILPDDDRIPLGPGTGVGDDPAH